MSEVETAAAARSPAGSLPRLETVEIETGPKPTASVIWLHGLGADGHDFEPVIPFLAWPGAPAIRWIFPHAPVRAVTINAGMRMRAWYDIVGFNAGRDHDQSGIETSVAQVNVLLERELQRGTPAERLLLAGFSQGGAIAIQVVLRRADRLGGLIALSTYLLDAGALRNAPAAVHRGLPAFCAHGSQDPVVPYAWGEAAAGALRDAGYAVEWHAYPIPHSVSQEEIADIAAWLRRIIG